MEDNFIQDKDLIMASETIESLSEMFPCRQKLIELIYNLLGEPKDSLPSSIYVYGDTATGKTEIFNGILKLTTACFALVNCVECYTPRLLFELILHGLLDGKFSEEHDREKCDNMTIFVKLLRIAEHQRKFMNRSCVIVLKNCERLFNLGEHLFPAFQKLQEISAMPKLCVVFVSQILPEKYTTDVPYIKVFFPQYTKDEISKILIREIPDDEEEKALFKQFISFFLDTFYLATKDLNELKHQMTALYPKYIEPVKTGRMKPSDIHALYKNIVPSIKNSLNSVYLPGVSSIEESQIKLKSVLSSRTLQTLDLPYYAKYFLIAAFLASYNLPKDDKRLFIKNHGKKKKRVVQDQRKENSTKELLGPKIFTLDRMLAIFYAIMEEKTPLNANLLAQISTLVELRLLVRLGDDLDKPKYKCAVGIECVEAVSRTLDFNVRKYMVN